MKKILLLIVLITVQTALSQNVLCKQASDQNNEAPVWDNFNIHNTLLENLEKDLSAGKQYINDKDAKSSNQETSLQQKTTITEETINQTPAYTEKITQDRIDELNDIRNQAKLLYNANKAEEAKEEFKKIPDGNKISDDWLYLANIAQDEAKDMDAVFYLKKAIQADENNYKAHYNLGNIYLSDNKVNMAISEYNKTLKIKNDFSYAHYNKGLCYLKKNNYFNAKYEFGLAIKSNPSEPSFYYNLAYTYKLMKKEKKAQEALDIYEKIMNQ